MPNWPQQPVIFEINAWTWLTELTRRYGRLVTLGTVPETEWDALARTCADGVWLMGVWERSPMGQRISLDTPDFVAEYHRELSDYSPGDVSGSPYCIHRYVVDAHLGGPTGLAAARRELARRNLCLLLDYVPNHVAPDHPWISSHPEYFVNGTAADASDPVGFFRSNGHVIAHGKDPYFAPWPDTAQLNAYSPGLRKAVIETMASIAAQCDGVRCDMAMLLINDIFRKTWGNRAGPAPAGEYWHEIIGATKAGYPNFLFVAEAYWDLESELQGQGFDYCYDKRLYDRLEHGSAEAVREHLAAGLDYQLRLIRFLENHDEPRAAAVFDEAKECAAAVALMSLPGAKLLHEGQFEGNKVKHSVHLGRRPEEPVNQRLQTFYSRLSTAVHAASLRAGEWQMCRTQGWPDNQSCRNLLCWSWQVKTNSYLVVINYSATPSQGLVMVPWKAIAGRSWRLQDLLSERVFAPRDGQQMTDPGLYVDMRPWESYLLKFDAL